MDDRLRIIPMKHLEVLRLLRSGSKNATTSSQLMSMIGIRNSSEIREIIHDLVEVYQIPIAGSNRSGSVGYFLVSCEEEREMAKSNIDSRIRSMSKRRKVVKDSDFFYNSELEAFQPASNQIQLTLF